VRARLTARFDILRLTTRGKARNCRVTSSRSGISATVSAVAGQVLRGNEQPGR